MFEQAKQPRRTSQRDPLIASCQRLEKGSNRTIAPAAEAVDIPAHLVLQEFPLTKQEEKGKTEDEMVGWHQ